MDNRPRACACSINVKQAGNSTREGEIAKHSLCGVDASNLVQDLVDKWLSVVLLHEKHNKLSKSGCEVLKVREQVQDARSGTKVEVELLDCDTEKSKDWSASVSVLGQRWVLQQLESCLCEEVDVLGGWRATSPQLRDGRGHELSKRVDAGAATRGPIPTVVVVARRCGLLPLAGRCACRRSLAASLVVGGNDEQVPVFVAELRLRGDDTRAGSV
jgi:hypothetical protein